jgi:very-short-patch-repair endonuclease
MQALQEIIKKLTSEKPSICAGNLESPIEERLLNHIEKYIRGGIEIHPQYAVQTISGDFRIDFVLSSANRKIAIECDGIEFHTKNDDDWYDEWRDVLILFQSEVDTIYRVKGKDIFLNIIDIVYFIGEQEQEIFKVDTHKLTSLIHRGTLNNKKWDTGDRKRIIYDSFDDEGNTCERLIEITKRTSDLSSDPMYLKYILYSMIYIGKKIPELIKIFSQKHYSRKELIEKFNSMYPDDSMDSSTDKAGLHIL